MDHPRTESTSYGEWSVTFGQSHSHRIWRMVSALIDAHPEWAEEVFEADREKMLRYGTTIGMTIEEPLRFTHPDMILGLWTAAVTQDVKE